MGVRLFVDGVDVTPDMEPREVKAVGVEMWYDRHYRHWVIYPVDAEGNQLDEARYGFSKAEALMIKADIEAEWKIRG